MNAFMAAMPTPVKFSFLQDRIFKPRLQTIFEAVDRITPALKAANRMKETSFMRAIQAITPVNPLAGRA